jgi:hypothetical protein
VVYLRRHPRAPRCSPRGSRHCSSPTWRDPRRCSGRSATLSSRSSSGSARSSRVPRRPAGAVDIPPGATVASSSSGRRATRWRQPSRPRANERTARPVAPLPLPRAAAPGCSRRPAEQVTRHCGVSFPLALSPTRSASATSKGVANHAGLRAIPPAAGIGVVTNVARTANVSGLLAAACA